MYLVTKTTYARNYISEANHTLTLNWIDTSVVKDLIAGVSVDFPLLKPIWLKSETVPDWCFCNSLVSLVVDGFEFLFDVILPFHLLPFLSNLKTLELRNCNSVKAVFVYTKIGTQGGEGESRGQDEDKSQDKDEVEGESVDEDEGDDEDRIIFKQ
ncbi:hypothetical protein MTR_0002s0030 [Medicago truncatula]|uniref:Disease resistance protein At4g27190-like leucine-rich repeats domain-containing protein n=1 Tax=Medicago truncatula TaxID=3880 RepID=A0A072TVY2_MEDTR|nr:hypothetical protein MTR_0002s0030 [Medicago truncatula]